MIGRWRRYCVFFLVGGIVSESTVAWGLVVGDFSAWLLRRLAWVRRGQFGNDDASRRAWVAVRASVVGLRHVRWVLSCSAVSLWSRSCMRWSVPAATMTGGRWLWRTRSVQAQHIYLAKLVVKVGAISRWRVWPTVGMWPGRPVVVPNVVMFHDDIGAFVSVFGWFPTNEPVKFSFFLFQGIQESIPWKLTSSGNLETSTCTIGCWAYVLDLMWTVPPFFADEHPSVWFFVCTNPLLLSLLYRWRPWSNELRKFGSVVKRKQI
jgi:hypothetical protein